MTRSALATRMFLLTGLTVVALEAGIEGTSAGQCAAACNAVATVCTNFHLKVCGLCWYSAQVPNGACVTPYCATTCPST